MTRHEVIDALRHMRSLYNGTYAPALDEAIGILQGADLSGFFDKLWRGAYERGKEDGKAERGTGKWIRSRRPRSYERWCSECGEKSWYCGTGDYTFCPHCGAEMRGDQDGPTEV